MSDEKKEEAAEITPAEGSAPQAAAPEAAVPSATQSEKASAEAARPVSGSSGGDRGGGDRGGPPSRGGRGKGKGRGGRFRRGRRHCIFCADKELQIDYKFVDVLEEFVSERGKIVPRRSTGTCAKHQRPLALSIKRARNAALLSYTGSGLQQ